MGIYYLITFAAIGISRFVGMMLQKRFAEFSQLSIPMTGQEVALKMLNENGLSEVKVTAVRGQLTDHYNPANKTVNLSEVVFGANNVAAAAVAAHECGHAVQHAKSYPFLKMRSIIVPFVNVSNKFNQYLLMAGMIMAASNLGPWLLLAGIALFAVTTVFSVITLPVEFNASSRALKWMEASGVTEGEYHGKAKKALFWAAMTYTVAALSSIGQLLYFISLYLKSQRR
ncbi:MAG: Zn-dependent membrane protease YugP [Verrucomicrobiales bacterium]|jgi:Zn-dependent membrane protease YugP